jgi:NAD(P)-dependent dehydrogenase (short-subunit alcohol dehydrogenase family)
MGRGNFAYSVSKGALNQMTRELAIERAQYNIRVNAIQPCQFMTPVLQELINNPAFEPVALQQRFLRGIPLQRIGQPEGIVGPELFFWFHLLQR